MGGNDEVVARVGCHRDTARVVAVVRVEESEERARVEDESHLRVPERRPERAVRILFHEVGNASPVTAREEAKAGSRTRVPHLAGFRGDRLAQHDCEREAAPSSLILENRQVVCFG